MSNETKKTVLISQPMGSRTAEEVREKRKSLVEKLEFLGYTILDNVFTDEPGPEIVNKNIYYLGKAIDLMCKADLVVFMDGWGDSRGCVLEYDICFKYNIPKAYESDILKEYFGKLNVDKYMKDKFNK